MSRAPAKPKTDQLRRWLRTHKRTQAALAAQLGISPGMLSLVINGRRNPSLQLAVALAERTGVSVRWVAQRAEVAKRTRRGRRAAA